MSWRVVARRDGSVTVTSRSVKLLLGLPALVIVALAYVYPVIGSDPITTARFAGFASGRLTTVVPLAGVLLGYNAVVSERQSGAIRLSLSLPHSRRDVVAGKYASRTGLLGGSMLAAMAVACALVIYPFGQFRVVGFLGFVLATLTFGAVWTGLGVAASLSVATKQRALVVAFGLFFLLVIVWNGIESGLAYALDAAGVAGGLPAPLRFVFALDPGAVYRRVTAGFLDPGATVGGPWYADEWVALVAFVLWAVGPMWLAARRFERGDLA